MRWLTPCVMLALLTIGLPLTQAAATFETPVQPRYTPAEVEVSTPVGDARIVRAELPVGAPQTNLRAPWNQVVVPGIEAEAPKSAATVRSNTFAVNVSDPSRTTPGLDVTTNDVRLVGKGLAPQLGIASLRVHVQGDGGALTPEDHRDSRQALLQDARGAKARGLIEHASSTPITPPVLEAIIAPARGPDHTSGDTPVTITATSVASTNIAPPPPTHPWVRVAAYAAGAVFILLVPWALYHRLRGKRTLEQDKRAALTDLLRERPGISQSDLARALGLDPSTVRYHLHRLEKEGLVVQEGTGSRRARYFAPGSTVPADRPAIAVARSVGSASVLQAVRDSPGSTMTELAQRMSVCRTTVGWHIRKLALARLVCLERDGRTVRVLPISTDGASGST
ncbi:MAG: winged helix-turn-helix transcriptional regulator [Candidatus Thermoplasmatota archaeon]